MSLTRPSLSATTTGLQRDVQDELSWEPALDASGIGVAVEEEGVVTLTGRVQSYAEKLAAEACARRVVGTRAVANDIRVVPSGAHTRDDTEIAEAVLTALDSNVSVPEDGIQVTVDQGHVTLDGEVEWRYQKAAAEAAIRFLAGVTEVTSRIEVAVQKREVERPGGPAPEGGIPPVRSGFVRSEIEAAFQRRAALDAERIRIDVTDGAVVLRGTVPSLVERDEAERAAWCAPGIVAVENRIQVDPHLKDGRGG